MFESLVIVTREGVEAALIVAIALAYLKRTGQARHARWVYGGVAAAVALSVAGALLVPHLGAGSELVEGWALLLGAVCVTSLLVWMHQSGRHMKQHIEQGLARLSDAAPPSGPRNGGPPPGAAEATGGPSRRLGPWLAVFVGFLLLREGVETVLFLTAISFNTDGVARLIGGLAGLGLAVAFGVLFVRGTLRVDLQRFFAVTSVILAVLAVQLAIGAYHEFAEGGYLPASRASMAIVGPIVRFDSLLFAAAVLLTVLLVGRSRPVRREPAAVPSENPAERRKALRREQQERVARRAVAVAAFAVVAILFTGFISQAQVPARVAGTPLQVVGGAVRLSERGLDDGHPHYFSTEAGGRAVRFFVMKKPDGSLAACLDACEICGDLGYFEEAGHLTCRNCTAPINAASLGRTGGCNPIPIATASPGGALVISESELARGARHFSAPSPR